MATKISVVGGNLFQIAAQYLGDATQANRLAVLNDILDPFNIGVRTLSLPDANLTAGGGLPFGPITTPNLWQQTAPPSLLPIVLAHPVVTTQPPPSTAHATGPWTSDFSAAFGVGPPPVNNPPQTTGPWLWNVMTAWVPPDPAPTLPRHLPTSAIAVRADAPAPRHRGWLDSAVRSWQPADPVPTLARHGIPVGVPVNAPPPNAIDPTVSALIAWQPADPPPTLLRYLPPSQQTISVHGIKNTAWMWTVLASWQPPDPLPTLPRHIVPSLTIVAPFVPKKLDQTAVLRSWQPQSGYYYNH